tara:strand:- start:75 stop:323 length:249 start_codon:yes stop_codon:yes gene_type:complete
MPMIYYQLSGFEWVENCETYQPQVIGVIEHFFIKFSKEQPIERLKLIFIDMYLAKHEWAKKENILLDSVSLSNNPIKQLQTI